MINFLVKWAKWFVPILGSILLFGFVHVFQQVGGFIFPGWSMAVFGLFFGVTLLGYLLQLNVLNRIGGIAVVFLAVVIVAGTLLPKQTIQSYPERTSQKVSEDFDAAWKAIYGKNLFEEFSLHNNLMAYLDSLADFDVHRAGQIGLFFLFGIALGICFLFPVDPIHRPEFLGRILLLLLCGFLWALQTELLQSLSPTRDVTFIGFLESLIGVSGGVVLFALFDVAYVSRKKALEDRRFNILGVGIDAVNMQDCLELFEEIIGKDINLECGSLIPLSDTAESSFLYPSQEETGTLELPDGQQFEVGSQESGAKTSNPKPQTPNYLKLSSGLQTKLPAMTTAMGVAGIVESRRRQKLQRILNESVLNTPDGMPLVWLGKLYGQRRIERVYGPDLLRDACAYGEDKGWRHYFWGAAPGIVEKLKEVLEIKHPKIEIAGICCPPFRPLTKEEEDALVEEVNASNTDIFWIGISTPKQLYFMDHIRDRLKCKIICPVGYAFDVNAGVEKDAPDWIKYAGLQWLHRGIKQPRLWKRYLPDNPMFILKVFAQMLHLKRFPMFMHERPVEPYQDAEGYDRFPAGCVSLSAMTMESARDRVANWVETGQKHYVNICTADTVVQCYDRPDMAKIVKNAGMATTDGMPLVWLARHFGFKDATRVYGPDLMLELCRLSEEKGYSHYFYGATDEVLAELKINLLKKFPKLKIAGMYSPPFRPLEESEKTEVAERINAAKPDIVWCGLGTPKQDYWVSEFRPKLNCAAILAVGAAFNFHAGHVKQAPRWMMKCGLEWLFRLVTEPKRLWRRYIIGNPRFVFQTLKQWVRAKHILKRMALSE
ncbi:WecB/TagA/CpsF family glycosyltransferase [Pontiella agarivorans]|uniref:WecB/TagA/CpsF family glycosyltransferase n=1 Tax=Pontiella agarivorans TaxID=3038953 RepID=A0ABU5MT03_9BACT|nr:WecB/TagA/CpsF family glycosyltransferase [Pontiella agarivorans]MDZ8117336.1 WecB/TagA/CpsF family glycosyltransferase [Pontiella agarivorans]